MTVGEFIYKIGFKTDQGSKGKAESEMEGLASKAKKLLGAIGIYYAGSFVLQLVLQIFGTFASLFLMEGLIVAYANASTGQGVALTSLLILIAAAMVAALGFFFYFTMLDIVERKLNLP